MARPFKDARYPGVSSRFKNGKPVYRHRAKGMPEIRLPGKPGDPEFEVAYEKTTQSQGKKAVIRFARSGTVKNLWPCRAPA